MPIQNFFGLKKNNFFYWKNKINRLPFWVISTITFIGLFGAWIIFSLQKNKINNYPSYFNSNLNIYGKGLPKFMHFCNDTLPLNDIEVKASIQKEFYESGLMKNKSALLLLLSRAERWFPVIEPIIKKNNLPEDIKYIAVIESHLSNVTSPMGARGFWQLLPSTAQNYGLEVNDQIDERLDVEKSTTAACKYLKYAFSELNNWTLVAAAYNYGINGIKYQINKQNTQSYHHLKLNQETKEFVYRIIAYKTLFIYPELFGIKRKFKPKQNPPFKTFFNNHDLITLSMLLSECHCSKLIFKTFNPWLLSDTIFNPEKKKYNFKCPTNNKSDYSAYISDLLISDYAPNSHPMNNTSDIQFENKHPDTSTQKNTKKLISQ